MESAYAEYSVAQKTPAKISALKAVLILGVILLFGIGFVSGIKIMSVLSVIAVVALVWYWPRFKVTWEYVYCDGQLDFDAIQGGERRKQVLRIDLDNADRIAPMEHSSMDGYRHLPVKDYSSLKPDAKKYGIVIKKPEREEKMVLLFEPSAKMLGLIHDKYPNKSVIE